MHSGLRRAAERLGRGLVYRRRLPAEFGRAPLFISPDAALRYLRPGAGAWDHRLFDIVREFVAEGDTVWDVGANVGVFSVAASVLAGPSGRVVAVEADVWLASLVQRTAALYGNIDVLGAAASDRMGLASFVIAERGRASNALATGGRSQQGGERMRQLVPTITLDALLERTGPPALVKIDVEGAEVDVLRGAGRVLRKARPMPRKARPVLYCEVGKAHSQKAADLLHAAGYVLLNPGKPPGERRPLKRCPFNTLAVPEERR